MAAPSVHISMSGGDEFLSWSRNSRALAWRTSGLSSRDVPGTVQNLMEVPRVHGGWTSDAGSILSTGVLRPASRSSADAVDLQQGLVPPRLRAFNLVGWGGEAPRVP